RINGSGLTPEWYDDETIQPVANPLSVSAGQTLPNINIDLALGTGCVTGTVSAPGGPRSGVYVRAFDANGDPQPAVSTDANGIYHACGLANGLYRMLYGKYPYVLQWNGGQAEYSQASRLAVLSGLTTTVDAELNQLGGCITGNLIGPDGLSEPAVYRRVLLLDA